MMTTLLGPKRKAAQFADARFVHRLWNEQFASLVLPEDFVPNWVNVSSMLVISAFKDARAFYRRFPDKTAIDLTKLIDATVRQGILLRTGIRKVPTVNAVEFTRLWNKFFPDKELPQFSLKFWVDSQRILPDVIAAFEQVSRTNKNQPTEHLVKLLSRRMSSSAMAREAQEQPK